MAGISVGYSQRLAIPLGLLLVYVMYVFGSWIYNNNQLQKLETQMYSAFPAMQKIDAPKAASELPVAAPDGNAVNVWNAKGRLVIVSLWSMQCKSCETNLFALKRLDDIWKQKNNNNWEIRAVSVDSKTNPDVIQKYVRSKKIESIASYFDYRGALLPYVRQYGLPVTFILNDNSEILYIIRGNGLWYDANVMEFLDTIEKVY